MRVFVITLFVVVYFGITGCSDNADCFVADTVVPVEEVSVDGQDRFLYLRSSGLNEKAHFYELYERAPAFDDCGKTNLSPISDIHVDNSQGTVAKVVIDNNKLSILYAREKAHNSNLANAPVVVR